MNRINKQEVVVKIYASSITSFDVDIMNKSKKQKGSTISGLEFSGEIVTVGKNVYHYSVGDEVYGMMHIIKGPRTHTEYVRVPETYLAKKPSSLSHEEAASLPIGMLTSLKALKELAELKRGKHVLINGASGGVGVYAVQLAKKLGCTVTGVCSSHNVEFVKELGADTIIDYKKVNITRGNKETYDVVFDVVNNSSFSECKNILKKNGIYITTNPLKDISGYILSLFSNKTSRYLMVSHGNSKKLDEVSHLVNSKQITPVVDRVLPFVRLAEAKELVESGKKKGVVILKR